MVFFRADSNKQIASGHIMRCISIAQAFMDAGEDVTFLIADENPVQMLGRAEMKYYTLHSVWNQLMGELESVKSLLQSYDNPLLVIDTYQVSRSYVEALLPYAKICYLGSKPAYLGRLQALVNYSTDIDYNFYKTNYDSTTKMLLGAAYAPLRKEFLQVEHKESKDGKCRILLTTGNTDQRQYIERIMNAIVASPFFQQIEISVVVGGMFENKEKLHSIYDNVENVHLHENVKSMSTLMGECDLAVSANGTTVYELAAAHVPAITFSMVEEQIKSARKLNELGVVDYCGEIYQDESLCIDSIIKKIEKYASNPEARITLASKANSIVDGRGCERIASILLDL